MVAAGVALIRGRASKEACLKCVYIHIIGVRISKHMLCNGTMIGLNVFVVKIRVIVERAEPCVFAVDLRATVIMTGEMEAL